jgi:hypothetical protein
MMLNGLSAGPRRERAMRWYSFEVEETVTKTLIVHVEAPDKMTAARIARSDFYDVEHRSMEDRDVDARFLGHPDDEELQDARRPGFVAALLPWIEKEGAGDE